MISRLLSRNPIHFLAALAMIFASWQAASASQDAGTEDYGELASASSLSGSFLAAQQAEKLNDDMAAVAYYRRSLELDPDNSDLKQMLFFALTANGRIDEAVEIARENLNNPGSPGFGRVVIAANAMNGKAFSRVGELLSEPSSADLDKLVDQLLVYWAMFGRGEAQEAIARTRNVVGPDWVKTVRFYHGGLMAAASGDDLTAIELFSLAVENRSVATVLTETYLRAVEGLVRAHARSAQYDAAARTLAEGQKLLPNHPPFLALQERLESIKPPDLLVTTAQQGAAEIFYNVGAAISRQNGARLAQSYLQLANFLRPKADFISMALADLFEDQEKYARSNAAYREIAEDSPYYRRSRIEAALNLNDLKRVEESEKLLRDLIAEEPDDLLVYSTLGGILSQHERYEEAARVYDAAVEQIDEPEANHWSLFYRRGIAYERIGEWEAAEPNFRKSLELSPDQADVLNYLGYSWIDQGMNLEEGMDMIRKAVELKPRSGYIVDSLGWAYYKLGEYEKAVEELERAVEIMPHDPVINDHLGDAYWKVGRKLEATFQWKHALAFDPELDDKIKIRQKLNNGLDEEEDATVTSN